MKTPRAFFYLLIASLFVSTVASGAESRTESSDQRELAIVVVDTPHRHHHQGKVFNVKLQLALPGEDVVVDMERPQRESHEDVYVVIRDAFDAAKKQLQQRIALLRGDDKKRDKLS